MSIDERLRIGLVRNTDHVQPDVERELQTTYDRVRVRRVRRGAVALAAVAAVATAIVWYGDVPALRDAEPIAPDPAPRSVTDMVGVEAPLEPGSYSMALWGESRQTGPLPRAILQVPEGYFSNGGYVVDAGGPGELDQYGEVMVWHVDQVPTDPCRPATTTDVGPTVDDLAQALVQQRGPSTRPRPVELAGHRGLRLEVSISPDMTLAQCPDGQYSLWKDLEQGPTDLANHLWILDVDGTRLVVVVTEFPDQPDGQLEELIAIAESIRFEPPTR